MSRLAAMTSPEFAAWARAGDTRPAVLVPVGAVEQHGPHLPLGVDAWLAGRVALAVAQGDDAVRVAEPLAYGSSEHHRAFAGTMSLSPATLSAVLCELCAGLWADGALPVIVNGHGGNRATIGVAIATLGRADVVSAGFSYFDLIAAEAADILPDVAHGTGHACALETSLMLHLYAETVRQDRIPAGTTPDGWPDPHLYAPSPVTVWRRFGAINPTGVIGTPSQASAEAGRRLFDAAVARGREAVSSLRTHHGKR